MCSHTWFIHGLGLPCDHPGVCVEEEHGRIICACMHTEVIKECSSLLHGYSYTRLYRSPHTGVHEGQ